MEFSELKLGDIIFFSGGGTTPGTVGQHLLKPFCLFGPDSGLMHLADPNTSHCAIVCDVTRDALQIAHALPGGFLRTEFAPKASGAKYRPESQLTVFRCKQEYMAEMAGRIACGWVVNETGRYKGETSTYYWGQNAYSNRKAFRIAGRSSHYGDGAKAQATIYAESRHKPVAATHNPDESKKMHCSMFVIAAWQAAAGADLSTNLMAKDARYTSPMALEAYLKNNDAYWESMGQLPRLQQS